MEREPEKREPIPLEELRAALEACVRGIGLRTAADHLGISREGLRRFVAGGTVPRPATRRRMEVFHREALAGLIAHPSDAEKALEVLTRHLAPEARVEVRDRVVSLLAGETLARGTELPTWMRDESGR